MAIIILTIIMVIKSVIIVIQNTTIGLAKIIVVITIIMTCRVRNLTLCMKCCF